ncbi:S-adenosyl-L-methionine-dependent methyltransferase [Obba rivulosa]|uniref:S-adenosyl-L-methionine-dependent methyltransferase n=1 Tax=Obba rivulosa TaxID=1052685 RepID=A0A8E2DSI6_9APHY|nr:S-adenosyl-L-methionine-dependent methyltransferase [Obba rivulosa]
MRRVASRLLHVLERVLDAESAVRELRWMQEVLAGPKPSPSTSTTLEDMVARRVRGEPLQYILGTQPFGPLTLLTRAPVLIPRTETEDWAHRLAEMRQPTRHKPLSVLDLCTGSGCIPLLLCSLWAPGSTHACGVDISEDAIKLSADNARANDIAIPEKGPLPPHEFRLRDRNTFTPLLGNIRDSAFVVASGLHPPFDIITSNPPYIPKREYDELPVSVKDFEDHRALLGDPDDTVPDGRGLTFYHTIAELLNSNKLLKCDGIVALEVGAGQARDVASIMENQGGMRHTRIWNDPWGKERVVIATN